MIQIEIENFQSIQKMSFSIDGFTTVIGRNFIGKSATLRAINAALTNQQGTDFIRWGEKFCEVRIITKEIDIVWHKEKGNNFYKVNGKEYAKIGAQAPPQPILDAGYGVVDMGGEKVNLFYAEQFFPLFLVDRNGSKSADLLISLYGLDRLYKAVELCGRDRKASRDILKVRKGDRDLAQDALNRFGGIESTLDRLEALKAKRASIEANQQQLDYLKSTTDKLVECTLEIKRLRPARDLNIPDITSTEASVREVQDLSSKLDRMQSLKAEFVKLRKAGDLEIPEDAMEDIQTKLKDTKDLRTTMLRHDALAKEVERLRKASEVEIPEATIDLEGLKTLKGMQAQLISAATGMKQSKAAYIELDSELETVETELSNYEVCPACGSKLETA